MLRNKLFAFLLLSLFLVSFVSAFEFDNIEREKTTTFDGKSIVGNQLLEKYKPIEIKNLFGFGRTQFDGYLSQHDNTCGIDCSSTIEMKTGQDGVLIDEVIFKTLQEDGDWIEQNIRSYQFKYLGDINDYKTTCISGETLKNGTTIQTCSQEITGSHKGWINYNLGDELPKGTYTVKLDAEKKPSRTVDWVIKTNGEWLESWATWGVSDLTTNLVAQYKLNSENYTLTNQGNVSDTTGINNGSWSGKTFNDGTVSGGVTIDDGAMVFDGVDGLVTLDNITTGTSGYSFSFWGNITPKTGSYSRIFMSQFHLEFRVRDSDNTIIIAVGNGSVQGSLNTIDNVWDKGNMAYYTLTQRTNKTIELFRNGVSIGTTEGEYYPPSPITNNPTINNIVQNFLGDIPNFQVYNKVLSPSEITEIYTAGKDSYTPIGDGLIAQYSGRDYNGSTASPDTIYDTNQLVDSKINEAFTFDGVDDVIETSFLTNGTDTISASLWVNSNAIGDGTGSGQNILSFGNTYLYQRTTDISWRFSDGISARQVDGGIINLNQWYHVYVEYIYNNDTNVSSAIYLDGELKDSNDYTNKSSRENSNFRIGFQSGYFNGSIDDIRIYNRSLTSAEISYLYNNGNGLEDNPDAYVTLNSPSDESTAFTPLQTFNATATVTSGATLTNMTLYNNISGSWILTNTTDIGKEMNETEKYSLWTNGYTVAGGPDGGKFGMTITPKTNITINNINKSDITIGMTEAYIQTSYAGGILDQATFSGNIATFTNDIILVAGTKYWILTDNGGGSYTPSYDLSITTSPLDKGFFWINKSVDSSGSEGDSAYNIVSLNVSNYAFQTTSTQTWNKTITSPTNWNVEACDSDGDCGFATSNYTVLLDDAAPSIVVESPSGTLDFNSVGLNETLNVTFTDTGLDQCWYNYNGTNVAIQGCLTGVKNSTQFLLEADNMNMTIYANDSVGNLNTTFINWSYKIFANSITFSNETRAGDQEDFVFNITLGDGYDLSSATFYYGNLTVSPSVYSNGETLITIADYQVPLYTVDTNVTFHVNMILDDSTEINSSVNTQLVQAIPIDNCSVYTNVLFNISLFDEVAKTPLNGDIEVNYNLLNIPAYDEINAISFSAANVTNISICSDVNLTGQNYAQSIEIRYVSDGYAPELYYIQRALITQTSQAINLYDLNLTQSTEFKVTYQDNTFNFVEGAIVQLQRKYISEDIYEVVEAPITSRDGVAVVHVDLDSNVYRATLVKNGEVLDTFDNIVFKCESELTGECELKLLGEINPQNSIDYDTRRDLAYTVTPGENNITVSYSIPSSLPAGVTIVLTQKDQFSNETTCNKTITSSAGSIQCTHEDMLGIGYLELSIYKDGVPVGENTYVIDEDTGMDFLDNNYIIVVVLILSLVGMALTSPEWIVVNSVLTLLLSGMLWLVNGINFVAGLGILMWLVLAAGIIILKLSKQEDQ